MSQTITSYKGFDKDLKCRGFQFEIGKEYEEPIVSVCSSGFHACKRPLDVFNYYPPANGTRYCVVEQSGKFSEDGENTKVASSKIKIGAEIGIPDLVKAHIEYVRKHCTNEHNAEPGKPATAGSYGAATAGDRGAATAGDRGAATAGDRGAATAGDRGAATAGSYGAATSRGSVTVGKNGAGLVRGNNVKIRGGMGAILTIAEENSNNFDIKEWKSFMIDGETFKPDTWYTLKDGSIVEAD
jgi:hypothetical protein